MEEEFKTEEIKTESDKSDKRNKRFTSGSIIITVLAIGLLVIPITLIVQMVHRLGRDAAIKDMNMLEDVRVAIITAMMDPEVMAARDQSKEQIEELMSSGSVLLSSVESGTEFYYTVTDIMGWNVFDPVEQRMHMASAPAKNSGEIMLEPTGEFQMVLWIVHSDFDGLGHDYDAADIQSLTNEIVDRSAYNHLYD